MGKMRVFVASASNAKALCDAMKTKKKVCKPRLRGRFAVKQEGDETVEEEALWDVIPWWDHASEVQQLGQTIIEGLKDECRKLTSR